MFTCFAKGSSVINLDSFWKQVFSFRNYAGKHFSGGKSKVEGERAIEEGEREREKRGLARKGLWHWSYWSSL